VLPAAIDYAGQFATVTSPASVAHTKRLLRESWATSGPGEAAINESNTYASLVESPDAREGVASFIERRRPQFVTTGIPAIDNPPA